MYINKDMGIQIIQIFIRITSSESNFFFFKLSMFTLKIILCKGRSIQLIKLNLPYCSKYRG